MTIQRINFIEKAPLALTYRKMAVAGGALFVLLLLIYGLQALRSFWLEEKVSQLTQEVTTLKKEKEKILKESATESGGPVSARAVLLRVLGDSVAWSVLLREVTSETPRSLWLTSLKSYEKKTGASTRPGILLNGQAEEAGQVTLFLKALSDSRFFENVVLTSSKQDSAKGDQTYRFSIDLTITPPGAGGGNL